jgi:putative heme iron utilization protein
MTHPAPTVDTISSEQDAFERARAAFAKNPRQMTMILARELNVPEAAIVRAMPEGMSTELDAQRWEAILTAFESMGQMHVIVSNASATIEAVGQFGGFSKAGASSMCKAKAWICTSATLSCTRCSRYASPATWMATIR